MGDKQYAENVAGSGGAGGSGEPADSFDEVATGLRDAYGNMIFKKSYFIESTNYESVIDNTISKNTIELIDFRGRICKNDGKQYALPFYGNDNYKGFIALDTGGLILERGNETSKNMYLTIYYIYKPVTRATSRKKTSED